MSNSPKDDLWDPASQSLADALNLSLIILKISMLSLLLLFLASGIFTVKQNEVAMVLRFGKIQGSPVNRILKPGLHWTWPYPLSEVKRVATGPVHTLLLDNFWYYDPPLRRGRIKPPPPETLDPERHGYCLTADANIIHSQWEIRYKIIDPYNYIAIASDDLMEHKHNDQHVAYSEFINKGAERLLINIGYSCIIAATAQFPVQDALYRSDELRMMVTDKLNKRLRHLKMGVQIQRVVLMRIRAPSQVEDAFESVVRAERQHNKKMEAAQNYRTRILNEVQGECARIAAEARNYKLEMEKETQGDAGYFEKLLLQYQLNPQIFTERHYQQIVEKLCAKAQDAFLLRHVPERELRIHINRNPTTYKIKAETEEE